MKLALDAMGGDFAPSINIEGALLALNRLPELEKLYLVGREDELKPACDKIGLSGSRFEIVHAAEVVEMHESGLLAVRQKKNSSMSVAVDLVKNGDAHAVLSAGNTGAAVAASTIKLRLLDGVERAGIVTQLPKMGGYTNVTDTGANPDAKPRHLVGYAMMASLMSHYVYGKENPRVGIMSNGSEEGKGNEFAKEAYAILKDLSAQNKLPFNFIGNVEGHDLFTPDMDVVLTDGFTGNVLLKTCEATAKAFSQWLKDELKASPVRMAGALLAKGAFTALKSKLSSDSGGGSPLLGVNGVSIIAHGSASATAIYNAIRVAGDMHKSQLNPRIIEAMATLGDF